MKMISNLSQKVLGSALALAMFALAGNAKAESVPQVITVMHVDGLARYQSADVKTWQQLKKGMVLKTGSVIQTGDNATVDIMLGEHLIVAPTPLGSASSAAGTATLGSKGDNAPKSNIIRIFPHSVLAVDKLIVDRTGADEVDETQLDLRAGQILGNVKKLSAASRYEVKLPNGVAGIRGTIYVVSASGAVTVLSGSVVVSYVGAGGTVYTQTVGAGYTFNPLNASGQPGPPSAPTQTPTALQTALLTQYTALNGSAPTPSQSVLRGPGTIIHISAD